jgi:hypothetical protein
MGFFFNWLVKQTLPGGWLKTRPFLTKPWRCKNFRNYIFPSVFFFAVVLCAENPDRRSSRPQRKTRHNANIATFHGGNGVKERFAVPKAAGDPARSLRFR